MGVTNIATGLTGQPQTTTTSYVDVLAATTTGGVFVFQTDLSDMVNGDVVELQILITHGARTERQFAYAVFAHAQSDPMKDTIPIPIIAGDTIRYRIRHGASSTSVSSFTRAMTIG